MFLGVGYGIFTYFNIFILIKLQHYIALYTLTLAKRPRSETTFYYKPFKIETILFTNNCLLSCKQYWGQANFAILNKRFSLIKYQLYRLIRLTCLIVWVVLWPITYFDCLSNTAFNRFTPYRFRPRLNTSQFINNLDQSVYPCILSYRIKDLS